MTETSNPASQPTSDTSSVHKLIRERYAEPTNVQLDKSIFILGIAALDGGPCIWCHHPRIAGELLRLFSFPSNDATRWFHTRTSASLSSCAACLQSYYEVRPTLEEEFSRLYEQDTLVVFWKKVGEFDVQRVGASLDRFILGELDYKSPAVLFALYELFLFPEHLKNTALHGKFIQVLRVLVEARKMIKVARMLPGLLVCMFDEDEVAWRWASSILLKDNGNLSQVDDFIKGSFDPVTILQLALQRDGDRQRLELFIRWLPLKVCCRYFEQLTSILLSTLCRNNSVYKSLNDLVGRVPIQVLSEGFWSLLFVSIMQHVPLAILEDDHRWLPIFGRWCKESGFQPVVLQKLVEAIARRFKVVSATPECTALIVLFAKLVSWDGIASLMISSAFPQTFQFLSSALGRCVGDPTLLTDSVLLLIRTIFLIDITALGTPQEEKMYGMMKEVLSLPAHLQMPLQAQLVAVLTGRSRESWKKYGRARPRVANTICAYLESIGAHRPETLDLLLVLTTTISYALDASKLGVLFKSHPTLFINCYSLAVRDTFVTDLPRLSSLICLCKDVIQRFFFVEGRSLLDMFPDKLFTIQKLLDAVILLCVACLRGEQRGEMSILSSLDTLVIFLGRLLAIAPSLHLNELKKEHLLQIIEKLLECYSIEEKGDKLAEKISNLLELATERCLKVNPKVQKSLGSLFSSLGSILDRIRDHLVHTITNYERRVGMSLPHLPPTTKSTLPSRASTIGRPKMGINEDLEERILLGMQSSIERRKERAIPISLRSNSIPVVIPKSGSKLDQLKAETIRDIAPAISVAPRKRVMPHSGLSHAVKLERLDHRISSASESEFEDDFMALRNKFDGASFGKAFSSISHSTEPATSRSVKLIELPGADTSARGNARSTKDKTLGGAPDEATLIKRFHQRILSFDLQQDVEAAVMDEPLLTIPNSFASASEYVSIFEPLLFVECRAQLMASAEETANDDIQRARIVAIAHVDNYHELQVQSDLENSSSSNDDRGALRLGDQDYLIVHFGDSTSKDSPTSGKSTVCLPAVVAQTSFKAGTFESTIRLVIPPDRPTLQLELREGKQLNFLRIGNVITNFREYLALHSIHTIQLAPSILDPRLSSFIVADKASMADKLDTLTAALRLNESQVLAIQAVLDRHNPITLIQGPPGTGKTRTIEGLLGLLVDRFTRERKILICAPSNAAIDEIVRRVRHGLCGAQGHLFPVRIIRVGAIDMIAEDVKDLTIESLVEQQLQCSTKASADLLTEQRKKCDDLRRHLDSAERDRQDEARLRTLRTVLWEAKEAMRKNVKFIEDTRVTVRQRILKEAQIICCTLSSSGHDILGRLDFDTVIIDEACQAIELSCLIPLQRNVRRCVLVGDPNQLPPTVISQMAGVYSYEQSMFVRLQRQCPRSVLLLDTQYRMHPEISHFPNQYFYEGRLVDGPGMAAANARDWHAHPLLGPFCFFDIHGGREESRSRKSGLESRSKLNELEAQIAANLVALLCQQTQQPMSGKIGLVTPYKDQKRALRRELVSRFGSSILANVEVSTVDGFQGQEKEVIIFSCVRTSEPGTGRGLGFLNDTRRLNVALTRAKCSLLILGRAVSLMRNPIWKALIEEARSRDCLIKEESTMWESVQRTRILPNLLLMPSKNGDGEGVKRSSHLRAPSTIKTPAQRRLEAQKTTRALIASSLSAPKSSSFIEETLDRTKRHQK